MCVRYVTRIRPDEKLSENTISETTAAGDGVFTVIIYRCAVYFFFAVLKYTDRLNVQYASSEGITTDQRKSQSTYYILYVLRV